MTRGSGEWGRAQLAFLSLPGQGDNTSTALVKSLETCLDVGMGRSFPALVGLWSPCPWGKTWGLLLPRNIPVSTGGAVPPRVTGVGNLLGHGECNLNCCFCFLQTSGAWESSSTCWCAATPPSRRPTTARPSP